MANELSTRIDRDKLFMVSRDAASHVAHALLHGGHNERGEMLAAAAAILFAAVCERVQMAPDELLRVGQKILHADQAFHREGNVHLEALRDFAGLRLRNRPIV